MRNANGAATRRTAKRSVSDYPQMLCLRGSREGSGMSIDVKEALRQRDVLRDMLTEAMRYCESGGMEIGDRYGFPLRTGKRKSLNRLARKRLV